MEHPHPTPNPPVLEISGDKGVYVVKLPARGLRARNNIRLAFQGATSGFRSSPHSVTLLTALRIPTAVQGD
jgi:hypothetical protein